MALKRKKEGGGVIRGKYMRKTVFTKKQKREGVAIGGCKYDDITGCLSFRIQPHFLFSFLLYATHIIYIFVNVSIHYVF